MNPDNEYEEQNDFSEDSAGDQGDNFYASRTAQHQIPIQKDEGPIEDPIDTTTVDSDAQLARDEKGAINYSNIISDCTRGAIKKKGTYAGPGDEAGLPGPTDGTSSAR